jgi:copper ion binding protein
MKKTKLNVKGMTCNMCVKHVTEALEGVSGVSKVKVKLEPGIAVVKYDPDQAGMSAFKSAVAEAGYEVVD